ncbi:MAG: cell division protein FtsA [Bdellovibrionales bacterium]|nr:cell division protein FtsA [Bdellovibrionales bacterium]
MSKSKSKSVKADYVLAGLDIGTTKVTCAIGSVQDKDLSIIGIGHSANLGMRQGVVVNIEAVSEAIHPATEEAELMAGVEIGAVRISTGGPHMQSFDSQGMVAIRDEVVVDEDVDRVIEAAKAVKIASDRQVLHVLPKEFKVDGQEGINDPIGMSGVRLESSVHIVTGSHSAVQNAFRCAERAGLEVTGLVLQQLASSLSVLSADERNLGVTVIDMGGGTCDMISYTQGSVVDTDVVPVGGNNFTHDVAMGLRTTQIFAEQLKIDYGTALKDMVEDEESIEVEGVGGREARNISRKDLSEVIEARAEETLQLIKKGLENKGLIEQMGSGVVLTGGASQLPGLIEMGDFVFDVPVRKGLPVKTGGLTDVVSSPEYATCVGLLKYGMTHSQAQSQAIQQSQSIGTRFAGWKDKLKNLFA